MLRQPLPMQQPIVQPQDNSFSSFIQSPQGRGLLYGTGMALLRNMNDRRTPIAETAFQGAQQFQQQDAIKQIGNQIANSNLTPEQKSFVQLAFMSQNSDLIKAATELLKPATPVSVGAGGTLVDPRTGKIIYQGRQAAGGMTAPTKAFTTQNQLRVQAIDNVVPQLKELIGSNFPGQLVGKYLEPSDQAAYEAKTASITDTLVGALGLPKTNESIDLVNKMVVEKPYETRASYKKRIETLINDLQARRKRGTDALEQGVSFSNDQVTNNPLLTVASFTAPNGDIIDVPIKNADAFANDPAHKNFKRLSG